MRGALLGVRVSQYGIGAKVYLGLNRCLLPGLNDLAREVPGQKQIL